MTGTEFTPISALIGGSVIGLSAVLMMCFLGRIMGISGIIGGFLSPGNAEEFAWRLPFVGGVIIAPLLYWFAAGNLPKIQTPPDVFIMALAGLLVGFGATLGSGCTSGHGVCGMARLSKRSIVAVLTFMATGFVTVYITQHIL